MMISDQWWESPDPSSWPRILPGHLREESEWLGDRWKVVFSVCTLCTECSSHQTWSMAGSLVCSHTKLTSPAMSGDSVSSADTRCLQWSLVSTSACSAESPAVLGAVKDSVYLLCDSHYWGLQRECEQAILSNWMVLVLLNGVYFGLQTTKEWLKRVSDTFVKINDIVLLLKNDFGLELALMVISFGCSWSLILFS